MVEAFGEFGLCVPGIHMIKLNPKESVKPWYRRTGYQILLTLLISALIAAALLPLRTMKPKTQTDNVSEQHRH